MGLMPYGGDRMPDRAGQEPDGERGVAASQENRHMPKENASDERGRIGTDGAAPARPHPAGLDLDILMAVGEIRGLDVSPDGRSIVFASTAGGGSHIYLQALEGGDPLLLTPGERSAAQP